MFEATIADHANSLGQPLAEVINAGITLGIGQARTAFKRRREEIATWANLLPVGPNVQFASEPDAPPPVATPEMAPVTAIKLTAGALSKRVDSTYGTVWRESMENLSRMSADTLSLTVGLLGEWVADGVEEELVGALEAATFATAQREANALSPTSLASAFGKHAELRTVNGALGPYPATLLVASDVAVAYAAAFVREVPGLTVIPSRLLASGRWYLLPPNQRAPVAMSVAPEVILDNRGLSTDSTARFAVYCFLLCTAHPTVLYTTDGTTPRWTIKGGT